MHTIGQCAVVAAAATQLTYGPSGAKYSPTKDFKKATPALGIDKCFNSFHECILTQGVENG